MRRMCTASRLVVSACLLLLSLAAAPGARLVASTSGSGLSAPTNEPRTSLSTSGVTALGIGVAVQDGDSQGRVRHPSGKSGSSSPKQGTPQATPREPSKPKAEARPRDDRDRPPRTDHRDPPRRAEAPPRFFAAPHAFAFEPLDGGIGFYYHPYFGFYVGPYYGPFYPFPGPFAHTRFAVSSLRLKVKPVETAVYLNGYYAGIVDDFDGLFQRLYVPTGEHHLELRLEGYERYGKDIYLAAGDSLDVTHQMVPLRAGVRTEPPPAPGPVTDEWTADAQDLGQPASPYGVLLVRCEPSDAQMFIDGEAWSPLPGRREFVMHLPSGSHLVEIRKSGYRPFSTSVDLTPGQTTPLNVQLER